MVNTTREAIFLGTYFYCYEGIREFLIKNVFLVHQVAIPMAGGISGAAGWFVSFPLDSVRAVVQGQPVGTVRTSTFEVASALLKQKGFMGLYSGVTPSIVRAFLVSGSRFSAYEFAINLLTGKRYHD